MLVDQHFADGVEVTFFGGDARSARRSRDLPAWSSARFTA